MSRKNLVVLFAAMALLAVPAMKAPAAMLGTPVVNLPVYYSSFNFSDPTAGAFIVNYDGNSTLTITNPALGTTPFHFDTTSLHEADGIAIGSDGNVYVTNSSAHGISELSPNVTFITNATTPNQQPYHITVDPTSSTGQLYAAVNVDGNDDLGGHEVLQVANGLGTITTHQVVDDTAQHNPASVTQIVYDPSNATWYYTASNGDGNVDGGQTGTFGTIDVSGSTFVLHQLISDQAGLHGLVYDPFSHDLLTVGDDLILQIDPTITPNPALDGKNMIVSSLTTTGGTVRLDQVGVDNLGHVLVADNQTGDMVFADYSVTGLIGTAGFVQNDFIASNLDELVVDAPSTSVPLTAAVWPGLGMLALMGAAFAARGRTARQAAR